MIEIIGYLTIGAMAALGMVVLLSLVLWLTNPPPSPDALWRQFEDDPTHDRYAAFARGCRRAL